MPWMELLPMDAKILFIGDWIRNGHKNLSALCREHGISRKTGYKWTRRYQSRGQDGLQEQSRRPANSPYRVCYAIRRAIIDYARRFPDWGPKKLLVILRSNNPEWDIPSRTTLYNILKKEGLVKPRHIRKRLITGIRPFAAASAPNAVWSADFKGQFATRDRSLCYPLTVMDQASRFLLSCRITSSTRLEETKAEFESLFREYGLPERIRTDNGVPFASAADCGLSRLSIWWLQLGIIPERIEPGKPQQNGRHERMHRTLKKESINPPAQSRKQQQELFDAFRDSYNHQRPHEAIEMKVPASVYFRSQRQMPEKPLPMEYPGHFDRAFVNHNGCIFRQGKAVYITCLLKGETVGLEEIDNGIFDVYYGPLKLGLFKERVLSNNNQYVRLLHL